MVRRILSVLLTVVMSIVCLTSNVSAQEVNKTNEPAEGAILLSEEEIYERFGEIKTANVQMPRTALPSSYDLSGSPCFPPIENQGALSSCTSFATTYYQYTYEVNRLNGVTSANDRVIYSPKWTYNFVNDGYSKGVYLCDNYEVLKNFGCLKNSDFPYTGNSNDYQGWATGLINEKREALKTRLLDYHVIKINETVSEPSQLSTVKALLYGGKVLTFDSKSRWNSKIVGDQCIAFRCYKVDDDDDSGHALTIVGYDDNKSVDVNGNGIIEDCEKGAFKVANSWGKSFNSYGISSTDGYFWILYDAINAQSANNINNWEAKYSGIRCRAINNRNLYSIDVAHINVNLVGELYIQTQDREALKLTINRESSSSTSWIYTGSTYLYPFNGFGESNIKFTGTILFDYGTYANPVSVCSSGYNWFAATPGTTISSSVNLFRLTDDFGKSITKNVVLRGTPLANYHELKLQKGDVNYDGQLTSDDSEIIMKYVSETIKLSNIQYYLADYNNDGKVNVADVASLNSYISQHTSSASELRAVYEINQKLEKFMEENKYLQSEISEVSELTNEIVQRIGA